MSDISDVLIIPLLEENKFPAWKVYLQITTAMELQIKINDPELSKEANITAEKTGKWESFQIEYVFPSWPSHRSENLVLRLFCDKLIGQVFEIDIRDWDKHTPSMESILEELGVLKNLSAD